MVQTNWFVIINVEPPATHAEAEDFMDLLDAIESIKTDEWIDEVNGPVDDGVCPMEYAYAIVSVKLLNPLSSDDLVQRIRALEIPNLRNVSAYENLSLW